MTHPTREEWMSFLYDELAADTRVALQTHLENCSDCRTQMSQWQGAAQYMSEWKLPRRRKGASAAPIMRWAIAAAVVGLAIVGGLRAVALSNEVKQLRAEIKASRVKVETALREHLAEEWQRDLDSALAQVSEQAARSAGSEARTLIAAVAQKLEEKRLTDQQATLAALQKVNAQHVADYASLRKELETVAVFTESGLQRAQTQIATLSGPAAGFSENK
jgi:hypothetical protein